MLCGGTWFRATVLHHPAWGGRCVQWQRGGGQLPSFPVDHVIIARIIEVGAAVTAHAAVVTPEAVVTPKEVQVIVFFLLLFLLSHPLQGGGLLAEGRHQLTKK